MYRLCTIKAKDLDDKRFGACPWLCSLSNPRKLFTTTSTKDIPFDLSLKQHQSISRINSEKYWTSFLKPVKKPPLTANRQEIM